jgi:Co/Zn/Cd efflux system component
MIWVASARGGRKPRGTSATGASCGSRSSSTRRFAIEIVAGVVSESVSLRADALDFLGDAANYALALAVNGRALRWRAAAALVKGGVMGALASGWRRARPIRPLPARCRRRMGMVGCLALAANLSVAALLFGYRRSDSQALSVWLCTRNDALINLAVIAAGAGAWLSGGHWPDIVVAVIVAALALSAALRITRQARAEMRATTIAPAE